MLNALGQVENFPVGRGKLMTSRRVGGNKTHSKLNAFGLIFPWQFILDDHDKDILTIANGKTPDTSSIFNISPKTTSKH